MNFDGDNPYNQKLYAYIRLGSDAGELTTTGGERPAYKFLNNRVNGQGKLQILNVYILLE